MWKIFRLFDYYLISVLKKISIPLARVAIFVVFFWFGYLKLIDSSPANPLVSELLSATLPFISFQQFIVALGLLEILIGLFFLLPRFERLAIFLLIPHMITTVLPLFLLPTITWVSFGVPTLEGQYIIKNIVIIALAFSIAAHLHPRRVKP